MGSSPSSSPGTVRSNIPGTNGNHTSNGQPKPEPGMHQRSEQTDRSSGPTTRRGSNSLFYRCPECNTNSFSPVSTRCTKCGRQFCGDCWKQQHAQLTPAIRTTLQTNSNKRHTPTTPSTPPTQGVRVPVGGNSSSSSPAQSSSYIPNLNIPPRSSISATAATSALLEGNRSGQGSSSGASGASGRSLSWCRSCLVFYSPAPSDRNWSSLMQLKVTELRDYLEQRGVNTARCSGKEELVDLVLQLFATDEAKEFEHQRDLLRMTERMQAEFAPGSKPATAREPEGIRVYTSTRPADTDMNTSGASRPNADIPRNVPTSIPSTNAQPSSPGHKSSIPGSVESSNTGAPSSSLGQAGVSSSGSGSSAPGSCIHVRDSGTCKWRAWPQEERILIEDVPTERDMDCINSRHLKDMLAFNFVNYRGALERSEIVAQAKALWRARHANDEPQSGPAVSSSRPTLASTSLGSETGTPKGTSSAGTKNDSGAGPGSGSGSGVCIICYDRPMDCVLLECGHLCTCTECARILAECPLCRRSILRVVHVFRA